MDEKTFEILTLRFTPGLGNRRVATLVREGATSDLCRAPDRFSELLPAATLAALKDGSSKRKAHAVLDQARKHDQRVVCLGEPHYPPALSALYDPPPVLFVRGSLDEAKRRVAIVGARAATAYGRTFARDLARGLSQRGLEVVSGLARGIDGAAHEGALQGGGTTLAVLGSSLDIIYPAEHEALARRVMAAGALLSEQPPGTGPQPGQFPSRNRIIVGLCEAIFVVEAGSRSGALITARVALEEGRDVLAVPGRPADPLSFGPNLLIRDGATLIRGLEDALEHLGLGAAPRETVSSPPDKFLSLFSGPLARSIDQLIAETQLEPQIVMAQLAELELAGKIERLPGTLFRAVTPA